MLKLPILASLTLSIATLTPNIAQAALITYDLQGTIDTGTLTGETYSGSFSFNDSTLTGIGDEFVPVSNLNFNFLSTMFTQFNADAPVEAVFSDGEFLGVEYLVTVTDAFFPVANFAFTTGFDISEAAFIYTPRTGTSGQGNVTFTPTSVATPEPSSFIGLLVLGGVGVMTQVRRREAR